MSQVLHGLEEWLQGYGFHIWIRQSAQAPFSREQTEMMHVGFAMAMLLATWVAVRWKAAQWIVVTLGILVLLNALAHIGGAALSSSAASGLVTSLSLWLPLGAFALGRAWRLMSRREFSLGIAAGLVVQLLLTWVAAFAV